MTIREAIARLIEGKSLSEDEADSVMTAIMAGEATPSQIAGFLVALRMKGETGPEVAGCARAMRRSALPVEVTVDRPLLDTCGTGGDRSYTMNISTAAAIVAAAAGVPVAKHGNRSVSSKSGSADVLEALGVPLALTPPQAARCLQEAGITFLFAPAFHPAMRHAQATRRELEIRTIFNLLGPLCNPAGARRQVVGVYDAGAVDLVADALKRLGTERALVVHGRDGLDELSIAAPTLAAWVEPHSIRRFEVHPESVGLRPAPVEAIRGGSARENAQALRAVLSGEDRGPRRDVTLLNAGAALWVAGEAESLQEGIEQAAELIDSGRAMAKLEQLVAVSRRVAEEAGAA